MLAGTKAQVLPVPRHRWSATRASCTARSPRSPTAPGRSPRWTACTASTCSPTGTRPPTSAELTRAVVRAATGPVIAAGSVASVAQIAALDAGRGLGFHHRRRDLRGPAARRPVDRRADQRGAPRRGGPGNRADGPPASSWPSTRAARPAGAWRSTLAGAARAGQPPAGELVSRAGRVEHDAGELAGRVLGGLADALGQAGVSWADVAGIGLAAQTETFVVWDAGAGQAGLPGDQLAGQPGRRPLRRAARGPATRPRSGGAPDCRWRQRSARQSCRWLLDEVPGAGGRGRGRGSAVRGRQLLADLAPQRRRRARHRAVHGRADHAVQPGHVGLGRPTCSTLFGVPAAMLPAVVPARPGGSP